MGQDDAPVLSSPGKEYLVVSASKAGILRDRYVRLRGSAEQTSHDVPIEVLVRKEEDHTETGPRRASSRSRISVIGNRAFMSARSCCSARSIFCKVLVHGIPMPQDSRLWRGAQARPGSGDRLQHLLGQLSLRVVAERGLSTDTSEASEASPRSSCLRSPR